MGDAVGIGYPQADEGKDAQLGVEQFARFGIDAPLLDQQLVEVFDEVGEEVEKRLVELAVEGLALAAQELVGAYGLEEFVDFGGHGQLLQRTAVLLQLLEVAHAAVQIAGYVHLFDFADLCQRGVRVFQFAVGLVQALPHGRELLHPVVQVEDRHNQQQRQYAYAHQHAAHDRLLVFVFLAIGPVDDGVELGHLQKPQAGVAAHGILHRAVQVAVGPVYVALFIHQPGQFLQRGILAYHPLQVANGRMCQVVDLFLHVALGPIGFVHGVVEIRQVLHVADRGQLFVEHRDSLVGVAVQSQPLGQQDGAVGLVQGKLGDGVAIEVGLLQILLLHLRVYDVVGQPAIARAAGIVVFEAGLLAQATGIYGLQFEQGIVVHAHDAHHLGPAYRVFGLAVGEYGVWVYLLLQIEVAGSRIGLIVKVFIEKRVAEPVLLRCR